MALSRTYLRAHWLSDAVAGTLIGAALALGSVALVMTLRRWWRARHPALSGAPTKADPPGAPPVAPPGPPVVASPADDATPRT